MSGSLLPELTQGIPCEHVAMALLKALLNPSGPEKGRGNAPTSWSPGVPWGVWEPSGTIVKSVPLCVYGVRDVYVCVVCVI